MYKIALDLKAWDRGFATQNSIMYKIALDLKVWDRDLLHRIVSCIRLH